jgi:hypothetical protein
MSGSNFFAGQNKVSNVQSTGTSTSIGAGATPASVPKRGLGRLKMVAVLLVCAAPVIASYLTFYVIKPEGRTNYGELLQPMVPLPAASALALADLQGKAVDMQRVRGNWLLVSVEAAPCTEACQQKLYWMRQVRTAQGKEKERVDRLWITSDVSPLETLALREFEGTVFLRAGADQLAAWLPVPAGSTAADHLFLMDPHGNIMLRWPKNADANKVKKDLSKLLRASNFWHQPKPPALLAKPQP